MPHYDKKVELVARYEQADVHSVNLSASDYSSQFIVMAKDGSQVTLSFQGKSEFKQFIDAIVTSAAKLNWNDSYPAAYLTLPRSEPLLDSASIGKWKEAWDAQMAEAVAESAEAPW